MIDIYLDDIIKFIFYFFGIGLVLAMILMADVLRKIAIEKRRKKTEKIYNNIYNNINLWRNRRKNV